MKFSEPRIIESAEDYEAVLELMIAYLFTVHRSNEETQLLKTWAILIYDYEQQARLLWGH